MLLLPAPRPDTAACAAAQVELADESAEGLRFVLTRVTGLADALQALCALYPLLQFEDRVLVPPVPRKPRHPAFC